MDHKKKRKKIKNPFKKKRKKNQEEKEEIHEGSELVYELQERTTNLKEQAQKIAAKERQNKLEAERLKKKVKEQERKAKYVNEMAEEYKLKEECINRCCGCSFCVRCRCCWFLGAGKCPTKRPTLIVDAPDEEEQARNILDDQQPGTSKADDTIEVA